MKLFFRNNGSLGTISKVDSLETEDSSLSSYVVPDDLKYIKEEKVVDGELLTVYITEEDLLKMLK